MTVTNNLKKMVDLPVFELCAQAPTASSATACMTTVDTNTGRYIYYLTASTFYRYDVERDMWQQLATPLVAPVTACSMRYVSNRGYYGRVISATATTVTIPGLRDATLEGETIRIMRGAGAGQDRILTYESETIHDFGVITNVTATTSITDSTKKWKFNQWAGHMLGITFGTDATQYKKIIYNDATTLFVANTDLIPHDPFNNQGFLAVAPYAVPTTTAGVKAHYVIMSTTFTVPSWGIGIQPDYTSYFTTTTTGGIYLLSSAAATPFMTLQYYDIVADSWQIKSVPQGLILAAFGTDFSLEKLTRASTAFISSTATSATIRTLSDTTQNMTVDKYNNCRIIIKTGTGAGQHRRIICNSATTFTVATNWDVNPFTDSTYEIWPDFDKIFVIGGAGAAMFGYSTDNDYWMQGLAFDDGIAANISCTMNGWNPVAVSTGVKIAAGVTAVNMVGAAGGANYLVGDILTITGAGGTGAQVIVTAVSGGAATTGVVTAVELVHSGTATGYTTGLRSTSGGSGNAACTVNVVSTGGTALITTGSAHWFRNGEVITFAGTSAAGWNTAHTIIGVNSTTSFSVATAEATMSANSSQSGTVIVDACKNWIPGEHIGRLVHLCASGATPTSQIRWITGNTATTITVATITQAGNGTSKYSIYDAKPFGVDDQYKQGNRSGYGRATGGSTTTLVDSTKNWVVDCWKGYVFKIEAGTGYGIGTVRLAITTNSENTLTFATQTFSPDSSTRYEIADTWGLITTGGTTTPITDTTKNWTTNQWDGKRFRITAGTANGSEGSVATGNSATAITGTSTTTDTTSAYAILSIPARGAGTSLLWIWGNTDAAKKGRYMFSPRGGSSNTADIYDLTTGKWTFGYFFSPQSEVMAAGSSYAYDGVDTIYFSKSVVNTAMRIFAYNVNTNHVEGGFQTTIPQNAAHIGNFLEVLDSEDGLSYIYALQNTGTILSRALIF